MTGGRRFPQDSSTGVQLDRVSVGYRRGATHAGRRNSVVLSDMTVSAVPGRVTLLLGPNGAGKSTLLRTITGLQPALSGRITVDGTDVRRMSPLVRARRIAVVLTERFEPGLLTGGDVVTLGRHPHRGPAGRLTNGDRAAVEQALSVMHAENLVDTRLAEMSDGQRQRIMVARALAQQTTTLVLDEPTAFLDGPARTELLARIHDIAASRNIAVLLSTHDVESALELGGDGWIVGEHRLIAAGAMSSLVADGAIGAAFDTPSVRFNRDSSRFTLRNHRGAERIGQP